jgi:N-glycosylase/DNA lyase
MTLACYINTEKIENAVIRVSDEIEKNKRKKNSWKKCSEDQLWHELVSCILGSRVRYEMAKECTKRLQNKGLLAISHLVSNPRVFEMYITNELNSPIYPPFVNGRGCRYPYPRSKSQYIIKTCLEIYKNNSTSIKQILKNSRDEKVAREILVKFCIGIGPKQASLFLRNVGYSENLAILDSHILYYMELKGLLEKRRNISTLNDYYNKENILLSYADSLNKSLATLDVAIWVVMRVIQKEFSKWV